MIPTINTKIISNNGLLGKVVEVTKNRISIQYESGNQTNIHLSKFPKMFTAV